MNSNYWKKLVHIYRKYIIAIMNIYLFYNQLTPGSET